MAPRRRATLNSRWWKEYYASFRNCYTCGGVLIRKYVKEEKSNRHTCGKCQTITYINPRVVAGIIPVLPDGRIVLLRRGIEPAKSRWSFPAGFQEIGETVEEAAARETVEEIQLPSKVGRLVGIYSYQDAGVVTIVYEGKPVAGKKPGLTPEAEEIGVFAAKDIPWKDLAFRSTGHALRDWVRLRRKGKRQS